MAKGGKLGKLKCMIKRWNSFNKVSRSDDLSFSPTNTQTSPSASANNDDDDDLRAVYVGKSRRRYLLSSRLVDHPVFRVLIERCGGDGVVGCEVVLFEHLLWMLENGDPQPESLDELVEYYAC